MTKKERAAKAVALLKDIYPDAVCSLEYNGDKPYELLISTRLSAQCTDARVNICLLYTSRPEKWSLGVPKSARFIRLPMLVP